MKPDIHLNKYPFTEVACDGSVLIDLLQDGEKWQLYHDILTNHVLPFATTLAITEAFYILCRKIGREQAEKKIQDLLDSNYYEVIDLEKIIMEAAVIKCKRAISLPDCFTIALAKLKSIPALFASRETELEVELKKNPFSIPIYFLNEIEHKKNERN